MNRIRKNDKAVSPVIATILMVAITVVLAGVLVVYLQTLPQSGGSAETTLGLRTEKNTNGDWLITVTGGSKNIADVTIQIINPTTGAQVFSGNVGTGWAAAPNQQGALNNNNGGTKLDAGDSILIYAVGHQGGVAAAGMKIQLLKGDSIVGLVNELPS